MCVGERQSWISVFSLVGCFWSITIFVLPSVFFADLERFGNLKMSFECSPSPPTRKRLE